MIELSDKDCRVLAEGYFRFMQGMYRGLLECGTTPKTAMSVLASAAARDGVKEPLLMTRLLAAVTGGEKP